MLRADLYYARMGLQVVILFNSWPPKRNFFREADVVSDNGPANWDITCLKLSNEWPKGTNGSRSLYFFTEGIIISINCARSGYTSEIKRQFKQQRCKGRGRFVRHIRQIVLFVLCVCGVCVCVWTVSTKYWNCMNLRAQIFVRVSLRIFPPCGIIRLFNLLFSVIKKLLEEESVFLKKYCTIVK